MQHANMVRTKGRSDKQDSKQAKWAAKPKQAAAAQVLPRFQVLTPGAPSVSMLSTAACAGGCGCGCQGP